MPSPNLGPSAEELAKLKFFKNYLSNRGAQIGVPVGVPVGVPDGTNASRLNTLGAFANSLHRAQAQNKKGGRSRRRIKTRRRRI